MSKPLTKNLVDRVSKYLEEELNRARTGRTSREDVWRESIERFEAKTVQKNWPWKNASNLHIPISAIMMDAIHARIMNSLEAQENPIAVEPISEDEIPGAIDPQTGMPLTWRTVSELLEQYFLFEISPAGDVPWHDFVNEFVWEAVFLGTGIAKGAWRSELQRDLVGTVSIDSTKYDNFFPQVLPLENVFVPPFYPNFDRIPWVTQRYLIRPSEALLKVDSDFRWNGKMVKAWIEQADPAQITELEEEQSLSEMSYDVGEYGNREMWAAETWMSFDLDGTGIETRILVDHAFDDPRFIFRVTEWPYDNGQLPFIKAVYIPRRKSFYGLGIPERVSALEDGISDNANMVADNVTAANTRLFKVRSGSRAARELDTIWPMKKIPVEQMDDLEPFQLGEVYPSAFELGNILRDYVERLSKVSDYNLGRESSAMGRQGTATSTMALLQESGQYFDSITRNIRFALNAVLQQWLDLLVQHKPMERISMVLAEYAQPVLAALSLGHGELRKRVAMRVSFSSTAATRELARQEELAKLQMLDQHYGSLMGYAQMRMQFPLFAPLIDAIARDRQYHMSRVLEAHGEGRTPTTIPPWDLLVAQMGGMQNAGFGMGAPPGAPGMDQGGGEMEGEAEAPPVGPEGGGPPPPGAGPDDSGPIG